MKGSKIFGMLIPILITGLLLIMSACTRKDNLTGDNWSNVKPQIAISDSFYLGYSFTNADTVSGKESYLLCGLDDGIETASLMQFTGLPDTLTITGQPTLKLFVNRLSAPLSISVNKITKDWTANATYELTEADFQTLSLPDVAVDTSSAFRDSILINLPAAVIQNWKSTGVTGFNLALKRVSGGWVEFKSTELAAGPLLNFLYHIQGDTITYKYNQNPAQDSYRFTGTQPDVVPNVWKLKNLIPQRLYTRFELPEFVDADGITLNATDVKRMTINQAELVLFIKDAAYYQDKLCYFFPFNVTRADSITAPVVLPLAELETVSNTIMSFKKATDNDSVKINITALVQGLTSGKINPNKGIVIINTAEMFNYGNLEFWHYSDAPAGKKPYVKIYYTAPFLGAE